MQRIKWWVKKNFSSLIYRHQTNPARKIELMRRAQHLNLSPLRELSDASDDIFTYHGEDGIIFYLLLQLADVPPVFVDIGAGDCIKSNCANLAFHFGWGGVFIDKNEKQLSIGMKFYKKRLKGEDGIKFVNSEITAENVNEIISGSGLAGKVGLLSIDIDGNDYWIWKAIDVIEPRIIVIEAKVEFGYRDLVVPYGPQNHHAADKMYNGASVEALKNLGAIKGYKLVGGNKQGYNLFFVKNGEKITGVAADVVLNNTETINSFYPESFFSEHSFYKS